MDYVPTEPRELVAPVEVALPGALARKPAVAIDLDGELQVRIRELDGIEVQLVDDAIEARPRSTRYRDLLVRRRRPGTVPESRAGSVRSDCRGAARKDAREQVLAPRGRRSRDTEHAGMEPLPAACGDTAVDQTSRCAEPDRFRARKDSVSGHDEARDARINAFVRAAVAVSGNACSNESIKSRTEALMAMGSREMR